MNQDFKCNWCGDGFDEIEDHVCHDCWYCDGYPCYVCAICSRPLCEDCCAPPMEGQPFYFCANCI